METKKSWTVVKFDDDASVAAVPTIWISNDFCLWPPFSTEKLNAAIKFQKIDTCWPSHKIHVFRNATYDSYEVARKKARKAEDTSDLNTDMEQSQQKRKVFKRKFISSSDDSESEVGAINEVPIPSPPQIEMTNISRYEDQQTSSLTTEYTTGEDKRPVAIVPSSSTPTTDRSKYQSRCSSESHAKFEAEILRQIYFLKSICMEMMAEIKNLKLNINTDDREDDSMGVSSILSQFNNPIDSEEELQNLEEFLKNPEHSKKMESEVCRMGGNNLTEFVRRCLGHIISDNLAVKYSWLGRREKKAFCHFECATVVINAALKCAKCADKRQAEVEISRWLRRARDRQKALNRPKLGLM